MADLNPAQFPQGDDPHDHTKWKRGDVIREPDWESVYPANDRRPEKRVMNKGREFVYNGPGNKNFVSVYRPYEGADAYHSETSRSLRVFKDGKVRLHKDGGPFSRVKPED